MDAAQGELCSVVVGYNYSSQSRDRRILGKSFVERGGRGGRVGRGEREGGRERGGREDGVERREGEERGGNESIEAREIEGSREGRE